MSGKRINCPKCSATIKVPDAAPTPKTTSVEDDWLGLDDPKPMPKSEPAGPAVTPAKPNSSPSSVSRTPVADKAESSAADPFDLLEPVDSKASRAVSSSEDSKLRTLGVESPASDLDLDDLTLEPISTPQKPVASITSKQSDTPIDLNSNASRPSLFDDDLPELAPVENVTAQIDSPSKKAGAAAKGDQAKPEPARKAEVVLDLDDLTLAPVEDTPVPKKPQKPAERKTPASSPSNVEPNSNAFDAALVGSLEKLSLDQNALAELLSVKTDEEFRFPCKVCGSALYASESRVGTMTRCPDCFSEFSIPTPPPKKKTKPIAIDETAGSVSLAPIDSRSTRDENIDVKKSKELLEKAAEAVEKEREELNELSSSFDSQRWLHLAFGFLRDPMIVLASVALGVFTACWLGAMAAMGTVIKLETAQVIIARFVLFGIFCIPILGSTCLIGLAILPMAANRLRRIEDWPFGKIAESFGELMMVTLSIVIASIPGGLIAAALNGAGSHPAVCIAFLMLSIWFITPVLLLSFIENGSIVEPYAPSVLKSMKSRSDAWGGMYMQTGLIMFAIYAFTLIAMGTDITGDFLLGFTFPFLCFMMANQFGLLAGRISDVTAMGFEGDFSDD